MAVNPDEDTEFNDALRKHGILPPREPTPPTPSPPDSPTIDELLNEYTPKELEELGEDANDDEAERMIREYRAQREAEDRQSKTLARFGRVYPIGRDDYTREVTEASKINAEDDEKDRGTSVVCFLYKDGIPRSERAKIFIHNLAQKHPKTKFVSIIGDKAIPNLPDERVPMILLYRKGEVVQQIVAWGSERVKPMEELEALLIYFGAVEMPRRRVAQAHNEDEDEDDLWDDGETSSSRRPAEKNIRRSTTNDDKDDDFEFDM